MYRTIIYTTWDNNWFQADKAIKDWNSEMDDWFVQQYKDTKEFHIWQEGINYVAENAKNYIMIRDASFDGLKTFLTNYFIGNMNDNQY